MEIGLREWLIVGAIIVILLIVIDGWRRMRAQSNSLKIDIDDKLADLGDDNYNPELPLGTARVFKPQDGDSAQGVEQSSDAQPAVATKRSEPEVSSQNIDSQNNAPQNHAPQGSTSLKEVSHKDQQHTKAEVIQPVTESSPQVAEIDDALMAPVAKAQQTPKAPLVTDSDIEPNLKSSSHESDLLDSSTADAFDENLDDGMVSHSRVASPKAEPEVTQTDTQSAPIDDNQAITNDIGFSAFDSDKPLSKESAATEPEFEEATVDSNVEKTRETQASTPDADAFTVPDILKKQSGKNVESVASEMLAERNEFSVPKEPLLHEVVQSASDENAASENAVSAEQIVNDLTAQLDTDLNSNLAAATDNTNSIVNNLLNTRALSKQELSVETEEEPSQQKYNNDEMPTESVLRRQEAVEAQAPSRSQINLGPDKFETLLAEREKDGFLPEPDTALQTQSETYPVEEEVISEHADVNPVDDYNEADFDINEHQLDDDDESAHNLMPNPFQRQSNELDQAASSDETNSTDEISNTDNLDGQRDEQAGLSESIEQVAQNSHETLDPQSEIEALKARLKALAPDEFDALEEGATAPSQEEISEDSESESSVSAKKSENLDIIPQRSENFDQIIAELDKQIEDQAAENQSIDDSAVDQASEVTTVIDDDVNLEDIDDNISHLSQVESIEQQNIEPLADPLMDGFKDDGSANDLMAQFEHDLQLDQQAVSNELDRPISEILRTQKAQSVTQESEQADEVAEDALLASSHDNALSESLLLGENFDDQDESDFYEQDLKQHAQNEMEDDGIDHANDLGFSAFEQDVIAPASSNSNDHDSDDPLMAGFNEPEEYVQQDSQLDDIEDQNSQKSLFNEGELEAVSAAAVAPSKPAKKPRKAIANVDDPNVVLIVTVVAKDQYLNGAALRRVVEACGMEFGDMAVFHRFEDGADQGAVQFSMANAINPGIFDIENMDETSTPGVSFFMSMDEPLDPKNALECMMATAETVATHLNGDLLDDDRSVLRPQTKEHYRERVRIHEMNKLRQRAL